MKRHTVLLVIWAITWVVIYGMTWAIKVDYSKFIEPVFLFGFLGVFIGFALSLYVHIVSVIQSIAPKFVGKEEQLKKLYRGLKENILVLVYGLVISSIVSVFAPAITKRYVTFLDRDFQFVIDAFSMSVFILAIWSLWDLMHAAFKLSEKAIDNNLPKST